MLHALTLFGRFGRTLELVNGKIERYQSARAAHYSQSSDGPLAGGRGESELSDDFIKRCSLGQISDPTSIERVRDAMKCADCHNGVQRGRLTFSALSDQQLPLGGNLSTYLITNEKSMPPGARLEPLEREAVAICLKAEYSTAPESNQGLLEQWLLQPDCTI